jgi:hypothetical protein
MTLNRSLSTIAGTITLKCIAFISVALTSVLLFNSPAHAFFSTIDTGEMVEPGKFQAIFEPQVILNKYDGLNAVGRLDAGLTDSTSVRGIIGFGTIDFQLGALYKWIPVPDIDNQPAIGLEAGAIVARVGGDTEVDFRLHPLISKRFETEIGDIVPYASLPIGINSTHQSTYVPIQLVAGAEILPLNSSNLSFYGEIGLNVSKAFSYVSAAVAFRFDEEAFRRH